MATDKTQLLRLVFIDRTIREGMCTGRLANCRSMAQEYEVSTKSILRDIDYLRNQRDAPIEYDSRRRGYYYSEENFSLPALTLTESDLFAICLAEKVLDQHRGMPVYRKLRAVYQKISEFLPEKVTFQSSWIETRLSTIPEPRTRMAPEIWEKVAGALRANRSVEIVYKKPASEQAEPREVDPYHILGYQGEWYLIGHCHQRGTILTFAMSRIHRATVLEKGFVSPADFSMETFLANRFGIFGGGNPRQVRIRFAREHAPFVVEREWHPAQELEFLDNGGVVLSFTADHLYEVKRWILSWGGGVKVLAPEELAASVREELASALREYGQPG